MESIINIFISLLNLPFRSIANLFSKLEITVGHVDCKLDKPRVPDGEGGFLYGSYGRFVLSIVNRKDKPFVLSELHCIALSKGRVVQDRIPCKSVKRHKAGTAISLYDDIVSIDILPKSSHQEIITFSAGGDLSLCDRVLLCYYDGINRKKIIVWER